MKSIKRIIVSSLCCWGGLVGQAHAEQPWQFGAEIGVGNTGVTGTDQGSMYGANMLIKPKFFNPKTFITGGYVGYVFHPNFGARLNLNLLLGSAGSKDTSVEVPLAGATVLGEVTSTLARLHLGVLPVVVYPFGSQDEGSGIFDVHLGGNFSIPISKLECEISAQSNGQSSSIPYEIEKDKLTALGMGVLGGLGYQIPGGVSLALDYMYEFTGPFKDENENKDKDGDKQHAWGLHLKAGYNFATLFDDGGKKYKGRRR